MAMQINQTGTYWYHSHDMGQYPDGFRGALIVHDPNAPFQYDEEITITLSDWYHQQMPELLNSYLSESNEAAFQGNEPLPDSALINDSTNTKIKVLPNKTYLVRIVCIGNWPGHTWVFDGHEMTVVEVDGVYTEPYPVGDKFLRIATGQRMSVLIKTKPDTSKNFAIWDTMDVNMMFFFEDRPIPSNYNPNATAWLVYDESKPLPEPPVFPPEFEFVDDVDFVPADREPLLQPVNHQIVLDTGSAVINGVRRFTVNNETYIAPKVPTLYTANTVGPEYSSNPEVYGQVNPIIVKYGDVVEIVINNHHGNLHPWHLHGHQFQVLQRNGVDGGYYNGLSSDVSTTPIKRDTIMVQNHAHAVIRFRADNPGVWMLHCHVEWHVEGGLMATIIEAPETFPQSLKAPPKSHYESCAAYPQPYSGNAAGKQGLDLSGMETEVTPGNHGAMYPANEDSSVPANVPVQKPASSPAPSVPKPSTKAQTPVPRPTHSQTPVPHPEAPAPNPSAPKPVSPQAPSPKPVAPQPEAHQPASQGPTPQTPVFQAPSPRPFAPPAFQQPAPQQPASQAPAPQAPEYNPSHYYYYGKPPHYPESIHVNSQDTKGSWPAPHTDESNVHIENPDKPHDHHITIHEEETKGPWPNQNSHTGYFQDGDHTYRYVCRK